MSDPCARNQVAGAPNHPFPRPMNNYNRLPPDLALEGIGAMVLSHDHQRGHRKRGPTRDTRRAPLNPRFGVTPPVPFETRKPRDCESQDLQRDDAPTSAPPLVQVYLVAPVEQGTGGACRVPGYFFAQIQEATGPGVKRAEPPRLAGPRGSIAKRFRRRNNITAHQWYHASFFGVPSERCINWLRRHVVTTPDSGWHEP